MNNFDIVSFVNKKGADFFPLNSFERKKHVIQRTVKMIFAWSSCNSRTSLIQ